MTLERSARGRTLVSSFRARSGGVSKSSSWPLRTDQTKALTANVEASKANGNTT
jgi:hypothetical protein